MAVRLTEIDGVPTVWTEAPGPLVGTLLFRVGQADERLVQHGLTHLIEHLALADQERPHLPINGSVDATVTSFVAAGRPDEVASFLTATTRSLTALPWSRIATEIRILQTEEAQRGVSPIALALAMRYGSVGYGMPGLPELGLRALDVETVEAWRAAWFTRDNAVLSLSGPVPVGIDLSALPDGLRRPPPEPTPLSDQPYPCWYPGPVGSVLLLTELERSTASTVAMGIAASRLRHRLRHEEGRSYGVAGDHQVLTARHAHGLLTADCLPDEAVAVRDACVAELHRLALHGPTADELSEVVDGVRRAVDDPYRAASEVLTRARDVLLDSSSSSSGQELVDEVAGLGIADVARVVAPALRRAVWIVPGHVGMEDRRIHPVISHSPEAVDGTVYGRRAPVARHHADRLVVGDAGVSLRWPDDRSATAWWSAVAAVQRWTDGGRTVWGEDGFVLAVHPGGWVGGTEAVAAVDGYTAPGLVVPMTVPLGEPELEPPGPEVPPSMPGPGLPPPSTGSTGAGPSVVQAASRVMALAVDAVLAAVALLAGLLAVGMALQPGDDMDGATVAVVVALAALVAAVFGSTFWRRQVQRARTDADEARAAVMASTVAASPASGYVPPALPVATPIPWAAFGLVTGLTVLSVAVGLVVGGDAGARLARLAVTAGIGAAVVVDRRRR